VDLLSAPQSDGCPCPQWKAIIALIRSAGLRCPSEIVELRWGDTYWERSLMTVRSPKTAAHDGHAVRIVSMTPELRPILQTLFDQAPEGSEAVLPRLTDPTTNLRTTFMKLIARAGYEPWPRLFHDMRASCATAGPRPCPAHDVATWLGHGPLMAAKHYLQTRDAHFEIATNGLASKHSNPQTIMPQAPAQATHTPA
jgi:integrase